MNGNGSTVSGHRPVLEFQLGRNVLPEFEYVTADRRYRRTHVRSSARRTSVALWTLAGARRRLLTRSRLGIDAGGESKRIVIFDPNKFEDEAATGWLVDEVYQVVRVSMDDVEDPPLEKDDSIEGVIKRDGDLCYLGARRHRVRRFDDRPRFRFRDPARLFNIPDRGVSNQLPVPSETMTELVKTGVEGLDSILNGGIVKNAAVLISGNPGTGKSILGLQYLYNGVDQFDEGGLYLTFEETEDDIREAAESIGFDRWHDHVDNGNIGVDTQVLRARTTAPPRWIFSQVSGELRHTAPADCHVECRRPGGRGIVSMS